MEVAKPLLAAVAHEEDAILRLWPQPVELEGVHQDGDEVGTVVRDAWTVEDVAFLPHRQRCRVGEDDVSMGGEDVQRPHSIVVVRDDDILGPVDMGLDALALQPVHDEVDPPVLIVGWSRYGAHGLEEVERLVDALS